ncbi:DUF305 domain-containing protein [Arsenicicoccus dermatophilus]|uniref:DUF305 domain-containing protein n=1 Tax=Arsenicicoccus dermatophilus TaxID=1076331 RepID=UPI001F4C855B|nr:DUF305 domain-containing protein [Arsenicicoccus dermatophilus]MCH8611822.1 DUF305 domain-containing protein [Arsenicicoccus dermatophilus]
MPHSTVRTLAVAALATATLAGCGGSRDAIRTATTSSVATTTAASATATSGSPTGSTSAATTGAHNAADTMFSQMMIAHHQGALDMSALAATRAGSPEVKALAGRIAAAQQPEIVRMKGWLTSWGESTQNPHAGMEMPGMDMNGTSQAQVMVTLKGLSGKAFDKEFLTSMIAHHQGALVMAQDELEQGQDAASKQLAQSVLASQQPEIDEMKRLLASL